MPLLALGLYLTIRLATADAFYRENTPESVAAAVRLEAGNATYHDLLAEHLESAGQNPDKERQIAVRLSPLGSSHWIALGVGAEVEKDYVQAEKYLLQAAKVNVGFEPRWALMNYYFRRGSMGQFALWTHRALDISYGDLTPVFRLCWLVTDDPQTVESMLPAREDIRLKYLQFLVTTKRMSAAVPIAHTVALQADKDNQTLLLEYCDAVMAQNMDSARDVWNELCRRKLVPFQALSPEEGRIVTNEDFRIAPTEHGFDWRIPKLDGVFVTTNPSSPGISIEMSGNEPPECTILSQSLPLAPGRQYRLDYEYRGPASDVDSGLSWEIGTPASSTLLSRSGDLVMTGEWSTGHLTFNSGDATGAVLSLRYKRALGTVRREGVLAFRKVAIQPIR